MSQMITVSSTTWTRTYFADGENRDSYRKSAGRKKNRIMVLFYCSYEWFNLFLVACYATLQPALSVCQSVHPSIGPSITLYFFLVFAVFGLTAPALVIKWHFFSCRHAILKETLSIRQSVGPSVCHTLLFFGFCGLWPHCSCPND